MNALDVAHAALEVAGSEADAVVQVERSGLARFARSEVHQPTLIENVVVTLRVVHDERFGAATTNKVDGAGRAELARRARLHQMPANHHADAIAKRKRFFLIVCDINRREPETRDELAQFAAGFFTQRNVEV